MKSYFKQYLSNVKVNNIKETENTLCEKELEAEENYNAIQRIRPVKSPGIDGIPIEFYKTFWSELKGILTMLYKNMYDKQSLTNSPK